MKKVVLSLVAVLMLVAVSAQAQVFKLSLWDTICVPNGDYTGGLEIGIGNNTQEVKGVQFAVIYAKANELTGVQMGLVTNNDSIKGVQWGFVNLSKEVTGLQWGCVNWTKGEVTGAQLGLVNYAETVTGLQWGCVNWSNESKGLKLGLVNYTETMNGGIEIGLVNIIKNKPNFLPVFVIFNFGF